MTETEVLVFAGLLIFVGIGLIVYSLATYMERYFGFFTRFFYGTILMAGAIFFLGTGGYIVILYLESLAPKF